MLSQSQSDQFEKDGYLRGPNILTDDQVDGLRTELERVIRDQYKLGIPQPVVCRSVDVGGGRTFMQIVNIWEASEAYRDLPHTPHIAEGIAQLTGAKQLRIWHDQIQYKPAGTGGVNMWHQDAPFWPIIEPVTQATAWIALDDVDEENGCMSMVSGSHLWGNQSAMLATLTSFTGVPTSFEGHKVEVRTCPVKKGEVHFHHALTWHGSPNNTSRRPRRAIALHYMTERTRYVASGQHVMKPYVDVDDGAVLSGMHFPLVWAADGAFHAGATMVGR